MDNIAIDAEIELFRQECKTVGDIEAILDDLMDKQSKTIQAMNWISKEPESKFRTNQLYRLQTMLDLIQMKYTIVYMEFFDEVNTLPDRLEPISVDVQKMIDDFIAYSRTEGRRIIENEIG